MTFRVRNISGEFVDLVEDGIHCRVSESNSSLFLKLLRELRVGEMTSAIDKMRSGFNRVIGVNRLPMLYGRGIAELATSRNEISARKMVEITRFLGTVEEGFKDKVLAMYRELDPSELSKLLRFATGMGTPPAYNDIVLRVEMGPRSWTFPTATTCALLQIIPNYRSLQEMLKYVRIAINYQSTITDYNLEIRYIS